MASRPKHTPFSQFNLPEQKLNRLTFCGHKPKQLQTFLEDLPSTQSKYISVVLYKLLPELNQLTINGQQRLALLTLLRPYVHQCINGLAEDFLKQPLNMVDNMTKIAAIGQALQRHLCDGYLITIEQLLASRNTSASDQSVLTTVVYYAIHGLGQLLYRSYQLYVPQPPLLWKKLNLLYELAMDKQLAKVAIHDSLLETRNRLSCEQAYFRTLALGCSNTNQLRQIDIAHLYRALEQWSEHIALSPLETGDSSIYVVDLHSDTGPVYECRQASIGEPEKLYAIHLQGLAEQLRDDSRHLREQSHIPEAFQQTLINHVLSCWQAKQERQQSRIQTDTLLEVCIGLKAAHQQLLHGQSFREFLRHCQPESQPPDSDGESASSQDAEPASETVLQVTATDKSSDGYCLRWDGDIPPQARTGEIILLRRPGDSDWQAGTIRWAQRLNLMTYVGVQLLASQAEAAAASTTLDNGQTTPFFRTVLLKNTLNQDSDSLLTPTVPFGIRQKIQLQQLGSCNQAQLTQLLVSSGCISQFSYRRL